MAGFVENVNTLAQALTPEVYADLQTVADDVGNINAVADSIANVDAVADSIANMNTVAGHIANVDTVAGHIANVDALGPIANDIDTLAPQAANIATLVTHATSIETAAANIDGINAVAADINQVSFSDIEDLGLITEPVTTNPAGTISYIKEVAEDITSVVATGTNIASVVTTAGSIANVNTVAGNIAGVGSVATTVVPNITELLQVNDNAALVVSILDQFDDRYLGDKAIAPTADNDGNPLLVGALYFDTVSNMIRVWDGSAWSDALTLTAGSISTLANKTIDSITNFVGADHVHYACRNESGATIPAGVVVTASGTQPGTDYIQIVPLTNNQTQTALGITHTSIANNGTGLVINTGLSTDVVDTSTWAVGDILYVGSTGGLTDVKPASGVYQACAVVLRSHAIQGTLLVEFTEPKSTTAKMVEDILNSGIPLDMGGIV